VKSTGGPGWDRQTKPKEGSPHGWIQWKGTQVCMDVHCSCGYLGHVDDSFAYFVRCPKCKQAFMTNGYVELVPLTASETKEAENMACGIKEEDGFEEN